MNARIVRAPGDVIEKGTIVIEQEQITAVGADVAVPEAAERIDGSGQTVYAGFIDALTQRGVSRPEPSGEEVTRQADETPDVREGVQSAMVEGYRRLVHPSWRVSEMFDPSHAKREDFRSAGFTVALVAPRTVIFAGESALVSMGDLPARQSIIRDSVAQHAAFVTSAERGRGRFGGGGGYPGTTMGAIALFRQTLMDAVWHRELKAWSERNTEGARLAIDPELESLWRLQDGLTGLAMAANTEVEIHRALDIAAEQKMKPIIIGGREAWKVAERLKAEDVSVIVSLKWSEEPQKPKKRADSLAQVKIDDAESLARGLDRSPIFDKGWEEQAWEPKRVYDERVRLWQEEIDNAKKLGEAGIRFAFASYDLKSPDEVLKQVRKAMEGGLSEDVALEALTRSAARIAGADARLGVIANGTPANLTMMSGPLGDKKSQVKRVVVEGSVFDLVVRDEPDWKKRGKKDGEPDTSERQDEKSDAEDAAAADVTSAPANAEVATTTSAPTTSSAPSSQPDDSEIWSDFATEIEADRKPRFDTGGDLLIQNANLLTITGGDLMGADLLIRDGKIAAVGGKIPPPPGVKTIDLRGYFITPGLIDPHSHMCTSGGLNEGTLSATPEVRVADVVDSKDLGAFRALAGGVTMIHTMHGSANTVGGQNVVLRLKYGKPVHEWRVPEAPKSVKFALGENVKQSNSQTKATRFPNTRMGVEAVFRRSFDAALAYKRELETFERDKAAGKDPRPLRRDLRLDAFCDIHAGRIWVHCHCYRADEILRLLDMAESYGFRIAVLQHVLEGYRVIPEILRHGVSASTFSDWWAYKLEAYDAIPHNAARMAQSGIVTTVNSDSGEVIRHLNLEAAKSMRFGGLSPNDALRLCTLNGAITLGVEKQFGSIEVGKRADLAVFDGHPLDTFSKCVMTLIDGETYFQHSTFEPTAAATPLAARPFAVHRDPLKVALSNRGEYWIRGGTIHPIGDQDIENGILVISDGRIARVARADADTPDKDVTLIDATGLHVYPGLIVAGVSLGLIEIDSVAGSIDSSDIARFQPDLHALSAYNPFSAGIGVARSEGVTSALIISGGGVAQGQAGIVHLDGWSMPEARFASPVGLFMQLPSMSAQTPWWMDDEAKERIKKEFPKSMAAVESFFRMAIQYARMKALGAKNAAAMPEFDRRLEAMVPYVNRELPILFRADSYKAIREVIRFAEKYEVRPIIFGGRESWKVADVLAEKKIDVIITRSMNMPSSEFEPWNSVYANAAALNRAGVRFCFTVGEPSLTKQIGVEAGMAVAHGLNEAAALRSITLDAAEILSVGDKLGSLETGKVADVIITTDTPLQASNCVVAEFIRGVPVDLENKHTRDDAKFMARPKPNLPPAVEGLRGPTPMRMKPAA
ncbi:MAG: amidohydrolase family protein [Planctomycetes bacterium]|nr:amidohydrolase family protein [Planctomycetota bacterium]